MINIFRTGISVPVFTKTLMVTTATSASYTIPKGHYARVTPMAIGLTGAQVTVTDTAGVALILVYTFANTTITGSTVTVQEKSVVTVTAPASSITSAYIELYKM